MTDTSKKVSRPQIREVFLRNGARIEPARDDLPDWVYESVFELLDSGVIQQAGPVIQYVAPAVQGEPVAWQRVEQQHAPDVAGLVEALEKIASLPMNSCSTENDYRLSAAKAIAAGALATHRKQEPGHD